MTHKSWTRQQDKQQTVVICECLQKTKVARENQEVGATVVKIDAWGQKDTGVGPGAAVGRGEGPDLVTEIQVGVSGCREVQVAVVVGVAAAVTVIGKQTQLEQERGKFLLKRTQEVGAGTEKTRKAAEVLVAEVTAEVEAEAEVYQESRGPKGTTAEVEAEAGVGAKAGTVEEV